MVSIQGMQQVIFLLKICVGINAKCHVFSNISNIYINLLYTHASKIILGETEFRVLVSPA